MDIDKYMKADTKIHCLNPAKQQFVILYRIKYNDPDLTIRDCLYLVDKEVKEGARLIDVGKPLYITYQTFCRWFREYGVIRGSNGKRISKT